MKKFTNKILIAVGIVILICNIVLISCTINRFSGYSDDSSEMYDEYYYDDDDYIMDDERH